MMIMPVPMLAGSGRTVARRAGQEGSELTPSGSRPRLVDRWLCRRRELQGLSETDGTERRGRRRLFVVRVDREVDLIDSRSGSVLAPKVDGRNIARAEVL